LRYGLPYRTAEELLAKCGIEVDRVRVMSLRADVYDGGRAPEATVRYWRHLGVELRSFKVGRTTPRAAH
jgi:hypothetical protein